MWTTPWQGEGEYWKDQSRTLQTIACGPLLAHVAFLSGPQTPHQSDLVVMRFQVFEVLVRLRSVLSHSAGEQLAHGQPLSCSLQPEFLCFDRPLLFPFILSFSITTTFLLLHLFAFTPSLLSSPFIFLSCFLLLSLFPALLLFLFIHSFCPLILLTFIYPFLSFQQLFCSFFGILSKSIY